MGRQILVGDAEVAEAPHQRGDAGALGMAVELVAQHVAVVARARRSSRQAPAGARGSGSASMMSSVFRPIFAISDVLLVDRDQLAAG